MERLTGLLGIAVLLGVCWMMSENRRRPAWRVIAGGLSLQFALAWLMLSFAPVVAVFRWIAGVIDGVIRRADAGIEFLFGPELADPSGPWGFVFAIRVLPVIVFFAALMAVMFHIGVMQRVILLLAWLLRRVLGVSGSEATAMAANVFVGQTEAPLCVGPLLERMTRSQLATIMVGGFATIAGSVLAAYVGLLGGQDDETRRLFITHLVTASVISAPAAFVAARLIVPASESAPDEAGTLAEVAGRDGNLLDSAAEGASQGMRLALNVAAMLVAFVSLLALINWPLNAIGETAWGVSLFGEQGLSLQRILGWIGAPLAWCMGVPWADAPAFGSLLGEKLIATEFIAFSSLSEMQADGTLGRRSVIIATYALCGFANFASVAIQIGGLSALAPSRRREIASMGLKAMLGGACASWMTACVAGVLVA
ncbi:MAG: nucleoside transporter C-terminal domain-containing protein [Planctomycetota bacterium]